MPGGSGERRGSLARPASRALPWDQDSALQRTRIASVARDEPGNVIDLLLDLRPLVLP